MKATKIRLMVEGQEKVTVYVAGPFKETVAKFLGRHLQAEEGDGSEAIHEEVEIEEAR